MTTRCRRIALRVACGLTFGVLAHAAEPQSASVRWAEVLNQAPAWYGTDEARRIADRVLQHQREHGGWPKNTDLTLPPDPAVLAAARATPDSTLDNGATVTEMRFLARVYRVSSDERYRDALIKGLDYLLAAQYPNGGWPQFYPLRTDYARYITFNDDAMIRVVTLLSEVAAANGDGAFADSARRVRSRAAVEKAVDVIRRAQIRVDGRLTAWCAQHDEVTLEPRKARAYEHPSLSGQETVGIVRFLMSREHSDTRIVEAIEAAVAWLKSAQIKGLRVEQRRDPSLPEGPDVVVVADPSAPPLWARFYEIGTNRPIFSGRDGVIRYSLTEIEHERRIGYAWLGTWPARLLDTEYPAWKKTVATRDSRFAVR
jgi:PelA/Pel-15E family pectate lyase